MSGARRWVALLREAVVTAWAQPVASAVSIIIVAGMCATVLLTTGRTVGAEQAVLGSIDSAGTRSIVIRAEASAGLDSSVMDRIAVIDGIAWSGAFGPATDASNVAVPGAVKVPVRRVWSADLGGLGIPAAQPVADRTVWASTETLALWGMPDEVGGVVTGAGAEFAVAGSMSEPDFLDFLQPLAVAPQSAESGVGRVSALVVIATRPDLVVPVSRAVQSVLGVDDPTAVTVTTSEDLAALRALIEGQLGSFGRNLVLTVFAVTAILVAAILYGLVVLRRRDFGRRRALGASQSLIVALLLAQMTVLSIVGSGVGAAVAAVVLAAAGDPLPGVAFFCAVAVLGVAVAVVAAVVPAIAAARRDPLRELRVP